MNDFVVYHNPDVMGYEAIDVDKLAVYTNKPAPNAVGARVWLITGREKPRKYYLRAVFLVRSVDESDKPEFQTRISGRAGQFLDPMPELNGEAWFPRFRQAQGNFAFGFQRIGDTKVVAALSA